MFFLLASIILAPDIVITQVEPVSTRKVKLHIGDMCTVSLEGDYRDVTVDMEKSKFLSALARNGIKEVDIIRTVKKFKDEQMCDFLYYDDSLSCQKNTVKVTVGRRVNVQYSGEEQRVRKGPPVPFPLKFSDNIKYDPYTHYRIYLPKGPIKAVVFDIYGGGIDRLYYPFFVSTQEVSAQKKWSLITHYKKLFRGLLEQGIAVVTLRLADCRVEIRDPSYVRSKDQLFIYNDGSQLSFKHQAYFFLEKNKRKTQEMDVLKQEIDNFMKAFPKILPEAKNAPTIFLGMSFGGVVGLFIAQNKESEHWFDYYVLVETPTHSFKGIVGETIYDTVAKMTYLEKKLLLVYGDLDHRIYGGHDQFFINKIKDKELIEVYHMPEVGHDLPSDPYLLIQEIIKFCQLDGLTATTGEEEDSEMPKAEEA
jgi:hypothetical protein